jgi:hypothetical protein
MFESKVTNLERKGGAWPSQLFSENRAKSCGRQARVPASAASSFSLERTHFADNAPSSYSHFESKGEDKKHFPLGVHNPKAFLKGQGCPHLKQPEHQAGIPKYGQIACTGLRLRPEASPLPALGVRPGAHHLCHVYPGAGPKCRHPVAQPQVLLRCPLLLADGPDTPPRRGRNNEMELSVELGDMTGREARLMKLSHSE